MLVCVCLSLLLLISKIPHFESNSQHGTLSTLFLSKLLLISKIPHFESNSQPLIEFLSKMYRCYWYQRYLILKAIHNNHSSIDPWTHVVTDIKDTSFWKQFTTVANPDQPVVLLLLISKIPHFESNSQQNSEEVNASLRCYWYQRYLILKAIHNCHTPLQFHQQVVTDIKDTSFWKQFTTAMRKLSEMRGLLLISKIPHFESNSQQEYRSSMERLGCYWYQRYLILKAIHNRLYRVL